MQAKPGTAGGCGCGRSPTGRCCGWHALTEEQYKIKKDEYDLAQYREQAEELGSQVAHAQVAVLSDLDIKIAIVLGIYFAIMLVIALFAHILTRKYNDK